MHDSDKELLARALGEIRRLKTENALLQRRKGEPIAVVGMSCRFPGECQDPEAYWAFIEAGKTATKPMPADRAAGMPGMYGSYLDDTDQFDAAFFGIVPKEAHSLDPQQRLLLELAWHACESANIRPDTLAGRPVGVFVGLSGIDYALKLFAADNLENVNPYYGTGIALSPAAGRLSYFLKVTGPSFVVDTACSSSLVALHLACQSLRRGECEMALAAGSNRLLGPELTINFAKMGLMSADGLCRAFDENSDGYSRGEGGGMLVLKRLRDAEVAGDTIHALILGSAVNQDGGSAGLTVPSGLAQQKVIREALADAGVAPEEVDYIEAHGTGTRVGDPIEANSLAEVFGQGRDAARPLRVGSVKTNFGHLEAAAGMASCLKVIQALCHETMPKQAHFCRLNPKIDWTNLPLEIAAEAKPWPRDGRRRVAGVSGFGFAGTNAHVIFGEAPKAEDPLQKQDGRTGAELIVLSGKSPEALKAQAGRLAGCVKGWPAIALSSLAHTAQIGRSALPERLGLVATDPEEASALLTKFAEAGKARGVFFGRAKERVRAAFVFTGQGAQYAGMGRGLYAVQPVFRAVVDACAEKLMPELGRDIREVMFAQPQDVAGRSCVAEEDGRSVLEAGRNMEARTELDDTVYAQAGTFVLEYALAKLWEAWGVTPTVVLGHSIGEYAAACFSGVFSLEDGLRLIVSRGRLMENRTPPGTMLTVFAEEDEVLKLIEEQKGELSIAAVNGPGILLVSGAPAAAEALEMELGRRGVRSVRMRISRAFHSQLTEPILKEFERVAAGLALNKPRIPLISNLTGKFVEEEITRADYWSRHMRQSVRFCESMTLLHEQALDFFVEIGPEPTLLGLDLCFRQAREKQASSAKWVPSLRRGHDDMRSMLDSAGRLWVEGHAIDWAETHAGKNPARVSLPLYPYQRRRYWYRDEEAGGETVPAVPPSMEMQTATKALAAKPEAVRTGDVPTKGNSSTIMQEAKPDYLKEVQAIICSVSGLEPADLHPGADLLEMGLDSLMFVRSGRLLEKRFRVKIPVKRFYEDLHRIGPLVDFLEKNTPAEVWTEGVAGGASETTPPVDESVSAKQSQSTQEITQMRGAQCGKAGLDAGMDPVMQAHFRLMERYLELRGADACVPVADDQGRKRKVVKVAGVSGAPLGDAKMTRSFAGINLEAEKNLSPQQKTFLGKLEERYAARAKRSKEQTQAWRRQLADWKGSIQFRRSLKEAKFPIVAERTAGSRIWDIDGNEYVDLAGGMGVHFLGHAPDFLKGALHRQIENNLALGPQADLTGEVVRKICQLTGVERASLGITGSGVVMQAQRIARAATGKALIAQFGGSYHGIGSEVLVAMSEDGPVPISAGIPGSVVENSIVLDYGSEEALEWIRENAEQLAAVMVEPVQSRRPGYQPHRFLRRLRRLTEELGIVLIFDEMINGFRIHPGGSQAWFGIKADIVTYGKIVGGGLPLAVVAGKARYLDWIDGGFWQYGDESTPSGKTVFTGGTHNRHPLALAAANAALDYMIEQGPGLQERVNRLTERLVKELNAFFEEESVTFRVNHFGSQFRFEALRDAFELEVFFHLLMERGFYTWEQRTCTLSIAHTDEDIDRLLEAAKQAVAEMRAGGFEVRTGPGAPRRVLPMSPVQERLFAICQREGAEMPYHMSAVWEIRGKADVFRLQDAYQEVVRRHESLRTAFGVIAGKPSQYIIEEPRVFLETIEAAGRTPEELIKAFIRPFDLERPPLLRIGFVPLAPDRSLLLADAHHIAIDGLSMNVVINEFAELYDGGRLPPVRRQYRHAIGEMEKYKATPEYAAQEKYWLERLAGQLPTLALPTDFPRTGRADFCGAAHLLRIDRERTARLELFAREHGASLYMVLFSAFATLLGRLGETDDLIVGLPVGGRPGSENEEVVGMFVNSLALRTRPSPERTFSDFLGEVRGVCLDAYENSEYDFGELVSRLQAGRDPDRSPVFDVMFAYENADERQMKTRDLEIHTVMQFQGAGMFDFNADIIREAGVLNIHLQYATRLFRPETIAAWAAMLSNLLDAVISGPERPLGRLSLHGETTIEEITRRLNRTSGTPHEPTTLVALWNASAKRAAEKTAVACENRSLTYRALDAQSDAVAAYLKETAKVGRGKFVALLMDSTENVLVAILGVLKTGAAYVPIDPENPLERTSAMIADCGAEIVVVDEAKRWTKLSSSARIAEISEMLKTPPGSGCAEPPCSEDVAYVIYTSGSTGMPKGVMIEHRGISNSVQWRSEALGFGETDVTLQMPTYAFDASLLDIFPVLHSCGKVVMVPVSGKRDLTEQAARIRAQKVTSLLLTPSLHALYLRELAPVLEGLRLITVAGETMPLAQVKRHFELLPRVRLFNEYGPTENSVVTTWTELFPGDDSVSIGVPVAGNEVYVVDPRGELCGEGMTGELQVSGSGLARGYLNRPELSEKAFAPAAWNPALRVYRTGDRVRWRHDGRLEFLGRLDAQVKLRGNRIELEEVESRLAQQKGVKAAAAKVVSVSDEAQLIAYVEANADFSEDATREALRALLPSYMVPTEYVKLERIPLSRSGKIDRRALPSPTVFGERASVWQAPRGTLEETLAETWRAVLRVERIGRDEDYFHLGGDSIKGIQLISRLAQRGWRLDMQQLFDHPTVAGLAAQLRPVHAETAACELTDEPGMIELGAIQSWFLREFEGFVRQFNQAVWLKTRERWNQGAMETALRTVVGHHQAFRYRYKKTDGAWQQRLEKDAIASTNIVVRTVDLSSEPEWEAKIAALVATEQAGMDLEAGPLTRAFIVRLATEDRLFWTIHHLIVDGVSWRVLLEDLSRAYEAQSKGKRTEFPNRTASFGCWAKAVRRTVEAGALKEEEPYWRKVIEGTMPRLKNDTQAAGGTVARLVTLAAEIDGARAGQVLREGNGAFGTRGAELLIAALRAAYGAWNPGAELYMLMECHGRDGGLARDIDTSRTVGWFTAHYPVRFASAQKDRAALIRETKEYLRGVPRQGVGFVWLTQQTHEGGLAGAKLPEITFNYLGDMGGGNALTTGMEQAEQCQEPRAPLKQILEISGYELHGRLHISISYDSGRLDGATVSGLLDSFVQAIGEISETTRTAIGSGGRGIPSPADFPHCGLDLCGFDRMVVRMERAPQTIENVYPLTPMQKGLYFEALKAPASEAYFEQAEFRMEGVRNVKAFLAAWNDVFERHGVLRSVFVHPEGEAEARQVVLCDAKPEVLVEDLTDRIDAERNRIIEERKLQDRARPFSLGERPAVRLTVMTLGSDAVEVVFSNHHILMDGWCIGIIYEDLLRSYAARAKGEQPRLEAAADYGTYLDWLQAADRDAARRFWRENLDGYDTMATLSKESPAKTDEYRCRKEKWLLSGSGWQRLRTVAAESGATTATLLQTLWGLLLARYNGTKDVVFGTIVSGRPEQLTDSERMVGLFVNAVPVRMRFEGGRHLGAFLRRFQSEAIARRPHEHLSLAEVCEQTDGMRELFDHLVVLENYPMEEELRGHGANRDGARPRLAKVESFERTHLPLTLVAVPHGETLEIEVTYNEALHTPTQIQRVRSHLMTLIERLAEQPEKPCLENDWLPAGERGQIEAWNATAAEYPEEATIVSLFEEQVALQGERVAVKESGGRILTYVELASAARRLSARLTEAGVVRGERVAVWLPRDGDMIVALLAVLMAGGCYVPLDPEYPQERLRFIIDDSEARVVVTRADHRSPFGALREVTIDAATNQPPRRSELANPPKPEDAAYVIYTSGSTGKPKGCLVSHRNVVRLMRNNRFDFDFGPEDTWIVAHSFCFDFSVWEMYGALLNGGRVVVPPREDVRDVRRFVGLVAAEKVTVLNQTPAAFYAFIEEALKKDHDFGAHLRYVVFGGDRLEPRYLRPWSERYDLKRTALINMYGITETTVHVTYHKIEETEIMEGAGRSIIGRPLPETEVWVMDELLRPTPIGVSGEMYVGGTGVSLGYLNRPELTAERFLPDPRGNGKRLYRTGDVGRWREDGRLEYQGRNDHQVQVRGFRVELGEVEAACLRLAGVRQAVVLPHEEEAGQLELVAYLVGEQRTTAEMRAALEPVLPRYMIPACFEWIDAIPLTNNGKTDRKALPKPGGRTRATVEGRTESPRNDCEKILTGLWKEALGVDEIGLRDNFFDIGGQSLKAVRLRARIEDVFRVTISLKEIFEHPTIAEMAVRISEAVATTTKELDDELATIIDGVAAEEIEAQLRKLEE